MINFIIELLGVLIGEILRETAPDKPSLKFFGAILLLAALALVLMGAWAIYIMITSTDQTLAEILIRTGLVLLFCSLAVICWRVAKKMWQTKN